MTNAANTDRAALEAHARAWAKAHLSPARFEHTTGVAETVSRLARLHQIEATHELQLAAWIHDAAKEQSASELLAEAERLGCAVRPIERQFPALLHGAVALGWARAALGIDDPVVTSAVLYHTTGHPAMSRADKAFYLADLIEPTRRYSWIDQARELALDDLDTALLFAISYQLRRLLKLGLPIDPHGIELRNRLLAEGVPLVQRAHKS